MKGIRILAGIGLAVLTDVAMGIIIFHLMGKVFNYELPIYFYLIGIFFSVLPDADLFLMKIRIIKDHHQFPSHYPIVIVPICVVVFLVSLTLSTHPGFWVSVAGLCLLSHYFDDSVGRTTGIGLRWWMPFGKKYYTLWPRRVLTEKEVKKLQLLSPEEWLEAYYLRITPELLVGIGLFIFAIILVAL